MAVKAVTAPVLEPVFLQETKDHLKVDTADDDALIEVLIEAARKHVETITGRALLNTVFDESLDGFPEVIRLTRAKVQTLTSITYLDSDGVSTVLATTEYRSDVISEPARITPDYGKSWPSTRGVVNDVTVRYTAGYGTSPNDVPSPLRSAILLLVAHWHRNREPVNIGNIVTPIDFTIDALLAPYRLWV